MKSLMLFLFLGATVALAEIHVDNDPNRNHHIQGLVSLNSLLCFCFVANGLPKILQQSELANCFQWSQLSLLMVDSLLNEP